MSLKGVIHGALRLAGLRLVRTNPAGLSEPDWSLRQILTGLEISVVFDVGAHVGQYATRLRRLGYRGRIVSFEPQEAAFAALHKETTSDPQWEALRTALGDREGEQVLNISRNSVSSSFLPVAPAILQVEPSIDKVGTETVPVDTLDRLYSRFAGSSDSILLKIDAQGYEANILAGAQELLACCSAVQLEMSLFPVYRGQKRFPEMMRLMLDRGFEMVHLERGFSDGDTGYLIEVDGVFVRKDKIAGAFAGDRAID